MLVHMREQYSENATAPAVRCHAIYPFGRFYRRREAEIKNGRVAMYATIGESLL